MLAENLIREHPGDEEAQIEKAFRLLTSRRPEKEEVTLLKNFLKEQYKAFRSDPSEVDELLKVGQAPISGKEDPVKLAAKTVVINTLMNFNESIFQR